MLRDKFQKLNVSEITWNALKDSRPPEVESLYLVAINGSAAFAVYRRDGNSIWGFNKDDVSFWANVPSVPSAKDV